MEKETIHKSIIRDFYRRAVSAGDIAFAEQIIADEYIQHSPSVKPGKAGLLEALTYMKQMPKPPTTPTTSTPFMRLIAEGDYVVTNMSFSWAGKQRAVIDLFRFKEGQVIEHWDAMAEQPETSLNGRPLMDGLQPSGTTTVAIENKTLVADFMQQVFINGQLEKLADFVAPDLKQHRPEIANGLSGLKAYLLTNPESGSVEKVLRIMAEGNFVVVQSSGTWQQKQIVFYDVFRLDEKRIVEHWGLK